MKIYRIAQGLQLQNVPEVNTTQSTEEVKQVARNSPEGKDTGEAINGVVKRNTNIALTTLYGVLFDTFKKVYQLIENEKLQITGYINEISQTNSDPESEVEEKDAANENESEYNLRMSELSKFQDDLNAVGKEIEIIFTKINTGNLSTGYFELAWRPVQEKLNELLNSMAESLESFTASDKQSVEKFMGRIRAELDTMLFPADTKRNV